MKTLLFSARDAAAAFYAAPIIRSAISIDDINVKIIAQEPALTIFNELGLDVIPVRTPPVELGGSHKDILDLANSIITKLAPSIVIVGLSSRGQGGIDEALLYVHNGPTVLIQDFWGEWNNFFDCLPDLFLVIDTAAAQLTQERYGTKTIAIGSTKHEDYVQLDPILMRQQSRERLDVVNKSVAGWFGQTLHHIKGYDQLIVLWAESMASAQLNSLDTNHWNFVYKPHPRETVEQISTTLAVLSAKLGKVHVLDDWTIEEAIVLCDGITAVMSNCLYDAAYLNYFSPEPIGSPISLLASDPLYSTLSESIDFSCLPYETYGVAEIVKDPRGASQQIQRAHGSARRTELWAAAKASLINPKAAATIGLNAILELI